MIFTEEHRQKAKLKRVNQKAWALENLKTSYLDLPVWRELASEAGVRLPQSHVPASETKFLKRILKKLDIDPKNWCDVQGYKTLKGFSKDNPEANAVLEIGLVLEYWREID